MRRFKICSPSNSQVQNIALLTVVTVLSIWSPELTHLITGILYPLTHNTSFPPLPSPWQPLFYSVSLISASFRFHVHMIPCGIFLSVTDLMPFKICICSHKWQDFLLFYGWTILMYIIIIFSFSFFFFMATLSPMYVSRLLWIGTVVACLPPPRPR